MSDLIERQAAIDMIERYSTWSQTYSNMLGDAISRQAAIDALKQLQKNISGDYTELDPMVMAGTAYIGDCIGELQDLPSAQPEPQWIPCSERLPEDDTLMLVNYIDNRPDAVDIWIGWHEMENVWYIDGEAHSSEFGNEVVAWMPLPEPWRGEEQ